MPHATTVLADPNTGRDVHIDVELAPLIAAIWDREISTGACCQDIGSGYTSVTFPTTMDMLEFLQAAVPPITADEWERLLDVSHDDDAANSLPYPLRATNWTTFAPSADPRWTPPSWEWRYAINPFPWPDASGEWDAVCTVEIPHGDVEAVTHHLVDTASPADGNPPAAPDV